jgi:hypothetical protein
VMIIGIRAHGHAARIWRAGARCGAGRGAAGLCSLRGCARSRGEERRIVPWLTDGSRRSVKGRRGKADGPCWAVMLGDSGPCGEDQGGVRLRVEGLRGL